MAMEERASSVTVRNILMYKKSNGVNKEYEINALNVREEKFLDKEVSEEDFRGFGMRREHLILEEEKFSCDFNRISWVHVGIWPNCGSKVWKFMQFPTFIKRDTLRTIQDKCLTRFKG